MRRYSDNVQVPNRLHSPANSSMKLACQLSKVLNPVEANYGIGSASDRELDICKGI